MFTLASLRALLTLITFDDWIFVAGERGDELFLQVSFVADDCIQGGRKWWISRHMTISEAVQTAFKAVLTAQEHEVREKFLYNGHAIFGPHFDVNALVALSLAKRLDIRRST